MSLKNTIRVENIINKNKDLLAICGKLKLLNDDKSVDIDGVIQSLKLPLKYHIFITGNFSEIMSLKF